MPEVWPDLYDLELTLHFNYLKSSLASRQGVSKGFLVRDASGTVVNRVGRVSNNPQWYQDAYSFLGSHPSDRRLVELAKIHLAEGYWDSGYFIPPLSSRLQTGSFCSI